MYTLNLYGLFMWTRLRSYFYKVCLPSQPGSKNFSASAPYFPLSSLSQTVLAASHFSKSSFLLLFLAFYAYGYGVHRVFIAV
jgi:hypothetical protein